MCQCKLFICTAKPVMSANDETLSAQGASQCSECCSLSGPLYSMMRCTALHWCPLYFVLHCPLYSVQGCHRLRDESSQGPRPSPPPLIHFLHPLFHLHPHPYPAPTHFILSFHPLFYPLYLQLQEGLLPGRKMCRTKTSLFHYFSTWHIPSLLQNCLTEHSSRHNVVAFEIQLNLIQRRS